MAIPSQFSGKVSFGEFTLDLETAELSVNGNKVILAGQPFQILVMLLERPGQLIAREEIKKRLWPSDTFVDFDVSLNKAVNRLRGALKDSAEHPRLIETLPRRGYRFIGVVGNGASPRKDFANSTEVTPATGSSERDARHEASREIPANPRSILKYSLVTATVFVLLAGIATQIFRRFETQARLGRSDAEAHGASTAHVWPRSNR